MSIIEQAVRKTAQRRQGQGPAPEQMNRPGRVRRTAHALDSRGARSLQPVTLNQETLAANNVLPQISDPAALRAYKILRTRILRRLETNQLRSFAVTGVTAGEGKTLTALNLALALAQDVNTWVFLVDLDLQRPRIAEYLGLSASQGSKGLSDYLLGEARFEEVVYSPDIERFSVVPNFQPMTYASELLSSPRMTELVHTLEEETPRRVVIFDMPPVLASDDVLAFGPQVDGLLLVVGEGATGRDALKSAKEVLAEMNLLGVVLNRSAERNDSAYYSYGRS